MDPPDQWQCFWMVSSMEGISWSGTEGTLPWGVVRWQMAQDRQYFFTPRLAEGKNAARHRSPTAASCESESDLTLPWSRHVITTLSISNEGTKSCYVTKPVLYETVCTAPNRQPSNQRKLLPFLCFCLFLFRFSPSRHSWRRFLKEPAIAKLPFLQLLQLVRCNTQLTCALCPQWLRRTMRLFSTWTCCCRDSNFQHFQTFRPILRLWR